jgi:uncharacterized Fe-S cluster-containing protein
MTTYTTNDLPGLDCGTCGFRSCEELAARLATDPGLIKRCIYLSEDRLPTIQEKTATWTQPLQATSCPLPEPIRAAGEIQPGRGAQRDCDAQPMAIPCSGCGATNSEQATSAQPRIRNLTPATNAWRDSLGREFDFYLEHFPEEPGPREIILPHNPLITREMDIQVDDVLIGRPLGMSCGCPITHCGVAMDVDKRTGVIVWCVTGPLNPRQKGYKDLGYYIAEGYEGLVNHTRGEIKIGMRYFFQPRMCMLQWRHSGLVNYLNRTKTGYQVRVEGLWIG